MMEILRMNVRKNINIVDSLTGEKVTILTTNGPTDIATEYIYGIVRLTEDYIEFGFFLNTNLYDFLWYGNEKHPILTSALNKDLCYFDSFHGAYVLYAEFPLDEEFVKNADSSFIVYDKETDILVLLRKPDGYKFPYGFGMNYEAVYNFKLFDRFKRDFKIENFELTNYMPYTFGIEFETSSGFIPQGHCFKYGLIPLRDGSISGLEYSTVVLDGNKGLTLLKQQTELLKTYNKHDKECSLHIHMGGFPLKEDCVFSLYKTIYYLQKDFKSLMPPYTFETHLYKKSGKDYCNLYEKTFLSFNSLFRYLTGTNYFGSFKMPHPNDLGGNRKWQIGNRYKWVNFINLLCFDRNKTVEFRFLPPSFNFRVIYMWLWVFNAILKFAEMTPPQKITLSTISLEYVIKHMYPEEISKLLLEELNLYRKVVEIQVGFHDFYGGFVEILDDHFVGESPLIKIT